MSTLEDRWQSTFSSLNVPQYIQKQAWTELSQYYSEPCRAYHNLQHLTALFSSLDEFSTQLQHPQHVAWAIWYHDIIYDARRKDNEERSAQIAEKRLTEFGLAQSDVHKIATWIRQTANHSAVKCAATDDIAWFLDFDLAILGTPPDTYQKYTEAVRKEYAHVPGFFYRRGRKKVLQLFLSQASLYRTPVFIEEKEEIARANIAREIENFLL